MHHDWMLGLQGLNTTIPSSVLGAALLHVAYLDLEILGTLQVL